MTSREGAAELLAEIRPFLELPDAVIATNSDGCVVAWNRGAERMYRIPAGEAAGRPLHAVLVASDGPTSSGSCSGRTWSERIRSADGRALGTLEIHRSDPGDSGRAPYEALLRASGEAIFTLHVGDPDRERAPDGDPAGRPYTFIAWNGVAAESRSLPPERVFGRRPHEILPPAAADRLTGDYELCRRSGEPVRHLRTLPDPDGAPREWSISLVPVRNDVGRVVMIQGCARDITTSRHYEAELVRQTVFRQSLIEAVREALERGVDRRSFQNLLTHAVDAIPGAEAGSLMVLRGGRFRYLAAVGYTLDALRQVSFDPDEVEQDLLDPEPQRIPGYRTPKVRLDPHRAGLLAGAGPVGRIRCTLSIPVQEEGRAVAFFNLDAFASDDAFPPESTEMGQIFAQYAKVLLERYALESEVARGRTELERLAFEDPTTGLPNRAGFLRAADALRPRGATLLVGIDRFSRLNDAYGHDCGDRALRCAGRLLRDILRADDLVARWDGDRFAVHARLEPASEAEGLGERIVRAFREPLEVDGIHVPLRVSVGTSPPDGSADVHQHVRRAELALRAAKLRGGDGQVACTPEMLAALDDDRALEVDLRGAVESGRIELHYQPVVALGDGRPVAAEGLARWRHPERGNVPPGRFIAVAERSGLIHDLGSRLLASAVVQAASWQAAGRDLRVAANLSAEQLARPDIVDEVRMLLAAAKLEPYRLELEVTESSAMRDLQEGGARLAELRGLGVGIAIDDFGTAYSSLAYLRRLPATTLKIDRSFVMGLVPEDGSSPDPADVAIVRAIVEMARGVGLVTVAEGIETEAQAALLRSLGCDLGQGWYFGRPAPANALDD